MIPIRDTIQAKHYPIVNTLIIVVNVLFYLFELTKGDSLNQFIYTYGLVPARYSVPELGAYFSQGQQVAAFFSFMFLHGGFVHLLGNMWSLYIFGDNIEDRLGPFRYLVFYLLCGWASGLSHLIINWNSQVPTIGASGAIAGVMGAYIILYPRSKILTLIPIFFIPYFIEIPAYFFLGIWFLLQFLNAAGSGTQGGGIAWWAHIGGFIAGIVFLKMVLKIPEIGISSRFQKATPERGAHRLQVINALGREGDPDLYGNLVITPQEARLGTNKVVNIPWGFQKRLFRVAVPSGVTHERILRLKGMGKTLNSRRGDLYLKVLIHS